MTPFAAFITLKKTVLKDKNGHPATPSPPILHLLQQAQQVISNFQSENSQLQETLRKYQTEAEESDKVKEQMWIELEKAQVNLEKSLIKNKDTEEMKNKLAVKDAKITNLETVAKDLKLEVEQINKDLAKVNKGLKIKEKEVFKFQDKTDNLNQTIKDLKADNKVIMAEKNKAVKEKTKSEKKLSDIKHSKSVCTKSTNTTVNSSISQSTSTRSYLSSKSTNTSSSRVNKSTNTLDQYSTTSISNSSNSGSQILSPDLPTSITSPVETKTATTEIHA